MKVNWVIMNISYYKYACSTVALTKKMIIVQHNNPLKLKLS